MHSSNLAQTILSNMWLLVVIRMYIQLIEYESSFPDATSHYFII